MENINVLSLFSGIGAFEKALDRKGIGYNLVNYCEFDKYASKSYSAVHGVSEMLNLGDITKVNISELEPHSADLITYGFPCQDISNAGKQRGFEHDGQLTRSGLFFYAAAIIGRIQPKVAICENVKALTGKKFTKEFETVLQTLEGMGYKNQWQVLNAKDYGIPQNRERVFIVSIRNDIDKKYTFPTPIKLELRLKDILEKEVDEKYYLSDKMLEKLTFGIKGRDIIEVGNLNKGGQKGGVLSTDGICSCLSATDYKQPKQILIKEATKKAYAEAQAYDSINLEQPNSKTRRGRVGKQQANTLTTSCNQAVVIPTIKYPCMNKDGFKIAKEGDGIITSRPHQAYSTVMNQCSFAIRSGNARDCGVCVNNDGQLIIRKLTPLECWRLMGFDDEDFYRAEKVNSNTQLYKQAGNSIVVNVLEAMFNNLKGILYD